MHAQDGGTREDATCHRIFGAHSGVVEQGEYEGHFVTPALAKDLKAYAEDQVQLQRDLAAKFDAKWVVLRQDDITNTELEEMAPPIRKRKHDKEEEEEEGAEREEEEEETEARAFQSPLYK